MAGIRTWLFEWGMLSSHRVMGFCGVLCETGGSDSLSVINLIGMVWGAA